ncbi:diguanylate cyclase [Skermanella sp. TT6]|uniref:diguanylate cyclase n=1 Tax=Skermanella cutis TaxID=2775420 RepID=A0ABX7B0P7_9PROT|nr:diguanylate cyclase [Skermanella sp. TT6]QQP87912.1 diguanylate cyclase [Skermanella sp. TT6]
MEQATNWADRAMARMAAESLPPTPQHFAIWYSYYSGDLPDLNRALDKLAEAGHGVTAERLAELHDRFFSLDHEKQAVREAGARIQGALSHLLELLRASGAGSDRYGRALQQFGEDMEVRGLEQLSALVDAIAAETRLMAEHNRELHSQLQSSSSQMDELRRNLDVVRQEAITDSLTGLFNRRLFDASLAEAVARAAQTGRPLSLLMTDIDHFKQFNDAHGHTIGDHVLALVARTVKESIRATDTAVRYGGEEFAVILPDSRMADAARLGEQIRKSVASKKLVNRSRNVTLGTITLSVGVAQLARDETPADLIKRADAALYDAKQSGRNRVVAIGSRDRDTGQGG